MDVCLHFSLVNVIHYNLFENYFVHLFVYLLTLCLLPLEYTLKKKKKRERGYDIH